MHVIKLGGSLLTSQKIRACLAHIVTHANKPTAVLCGGGQFADSVRLAQAIWLFDHVCAHQMAILAMQQTALLCQSLEPAFVLAKTTQEIKQKIHQNLLILISPNVDELSGDGMRTDWSMTSDSISAWFAGELRAKQLTLVKSCQITTQNIALLTAQGVVDLAFASYVQGQAFELTVTSVDDFLANQHI